MLLVQWWGRASCPGKNHGQIHAAPAPRQSIDPHQAKGGVNNNGGWDARSARRAGSRPASVNRHPTIGEVNTGECGTSLRESRRALSSRIPVSRVRVVLIGVCAPSYIAGWQNGVLHNQDNHEIPIRGTDALKFARTRRGEEGGGRGGGTSACRSVRRPAPSAPRGLGSSAGIAQREFESATGPADSAPVAGLEFTNRFPASLR